jgi:hypothetical protein
LQAVLQCLATLYGGLDNVKEFKTLEELKESFKDVFDVQTQPFFGMRI